MNPWLELNWRGTHARLVVYAGDQLQGRLPGDLIANVEEDVAIGFTGVRGALRPDVHITEKWDSGGYSGGTAVAAGPVAARGIRVAIDPADTRRIEIVDDTGVVITAIEFLSPTNKDGREGTREYRYKVDRYLSAGVNVVEIDLLRAGAFALNYNPANLRGAVDGAYRVAISRTATPEQREVFLLPLRDPLPVLPIPLRLGEPGDRPRAAAVDRSLLRALRAAHPALRAPAAPAPRRRRRRVGRRAPARGRGGVLSRVKLLADGEDAPQNRAPGPIT